MPPQATAELKAGRSAQEREITLSKPQGAVLKARKERVLNMAGQGSGKSAMIGVLTGLYIQLFPRVKGFVAANTYMQLNQSTLIQCTKIWAEKFGITPYDPRTGQGWYVMDQKPPASFTVYHKFKSYSNIISFRNGHTIFVGSLDNYLAHEGKEFAYAHLDETKDTKEVAIKQVILARIREKGIWYNPQDPDPLTNLSAEHGSPGDGWVPFNPCFIHTSPSEGTVEWLTTMFKLAEWEKEILAHIVSETDFFYREQGNRAVCIYSTYHNQANLPENYIQNRKDDLTEIQQLKFIYGYPFSQTGGEYYTQFSRLKHIQPLEIQRGKPFHISFDFNVLPYMTLIVAQLYEDDQIFQIRILKEYCLKSPQNSTRAVCEALLRDHQSDIQDLFYYGDASGKNRIAGQGDKSNFNDVEEVLAYYITSASDRVARRNKPVLKRRDFMERLLAGKLMVGSRPVELVVDPECTEMIKDLQYLMLGKDGKLKEIVRTADGASYEKLGHTSDALEYMICEILEDLFW